MKKWDWKKTDQPYFKIAVYVFIVLAATVLFEKVVGNLPSISNTIHTFLKVTQGLCLPFLMGFMIAYVMNPFINFFERHTMKNNSFSAASAGDPRHCHYADLHHGHRRHHLDCHLSGA